MKENKTVLVGMSGGIDSSVAAFLLQKEGYKVEGIYFQLHEDGDDGSVSQKKAEIAAKKIDIPLKKLDCKKIFKDIIISDFIKKYENGLTPNPCVLCNEKIKFNLMLDYAVKNNITFIATGHYAQLTKKGDNVYFIRRGFDTKKDQSYFLYRLNNDVLSRTLFPLGGYLKEDVQVLAQNIGFNVSTLQESQEICFINDNNYRKFIGNTENRLESKKNTPGYFVNISGDILGEHKGLANYTIGQRRKTGLSLNKRMYVVRINYEENTVVIGDERDLYKEKFIIANTHFTANYFICNSLRMNVQIRYNSKPAIATISNIGKNQFLVSFDQPQKAITPGQSAVIYDNDIVLGGGIIVKE